MNKKLIATLTAVCLIFGLTACQSQKKGTKEESKAEPAEVELTIFAAASMTETLQEIAELYKTEAPHVILTFNFDSSGTLKTQIEEGADCDVFISAAQKQMDELDASADTADNPDSLDLVLSDTRIHLLNNEVTLCVPADNEAGIKTFDDLAVQLKAEEILLGMGNSDVPVGQYTQNIFTYYELDEDSLAEAGKITYGSNVKEVTAWVSEGSVDAGIIYRTDAVSAGLEIVDVAAEEMCGKVIYPAAVLKDSVSEEEAKAFLKYIQGEEAMEIFKKVGFSAV